MKAVIFDCDGVLVDSEHIYQLAHVKFLSDLGLTVPEGQYASEYMGLPTSVYFQKLKNTYGPLLGRPFPENFETDLKAYSHDLITKTLQPIEGAKEFIENLRLSFAVASSTKLQFLHQKLTQTGLHTHFSPHIYSGEEVPRGKPFPDLFLHTAQKLNTAPQDCLVIEDSVNGVLAGVAAGMDVIGFCGGGHCGDNHHDVLVTAGAKTTVKNYAELKQVLEL